MSRVDFSIEDLRVIRNARRDERHWKLARYAALLLAMAVMWTASYILSEEEFADNVFTWPIGGFLLSIFVSICFYLAFNWNNAQRQLLIRLTEDADPLKQAEPPGQ